MTELALVIPADLQYCIPASPAVPLPGLVCPLRRTLTAVIFSAASVNGASAGGFSSTTVTVTVDDSPPASARISALPTASALALPLLAMRTIRSSDDSHSTVLSFALAGSTVAVKVFVCPTARETSPPSMATL